MEVWDPSESKGVVAKVQRSEAKNRYVLWLLRSFLRGGDSVQRRPAATKRSQTRNYTTVTAGLRLIKQACFQGKG